MYEQKSTVNWVKEIQKGLDVLKVNRQDYIKLDLFHYTIDQKTFENKTSRSKQRLNGLKNENWHIYKK